MTLMAVGRALACLTDCFDHKKRVCGTCVANHPLVYRPSPIDPRFLALIDIGGCGGGWVRCGAVRGAVSCALLCGLVEEQRGAAGAAVQFLRGCGRRRHRSAARLLSYALSLFLPVSSPLSASGLPGWVRMDVLDLSHVDCLKAQLQVNDLAHTICPLCKARFCANPRARNDTHLCLTGRGGNWIEGGDGVGVRGAQYG